ncbi:hypothetical protein [Alcanivorax sp.]|uniref:hypothetical protein n=1 Tax=Alcanivorax sp. TaxID=1872427 RepID=UPI0024387212|nr:hypothetical protein [Alcanivorax sp.]
MKSHWKFWCDAKNEKNAGVVLSKLRNSFFLNVVDHTIDPYHKGGYVISLVAAGRATTWNDHIVEVIAAGQTLGRGWTILGDINDQAEGWSNESNVSGITSVQWACDMRYGS